MYFFELKNNNNKPIDHQTHYFNILFLPITLYYIEIVYIFRKNKTYETPATRNNTYQ